ncbi:MAG: hypothetical protein J5604_00875 [Bacteroidales bacterium]|nr:hypothetical protein [Bacteroidales bacterium]
MNTWNDFLLSQMMMYVAVLLLMMLWSLFWAWPVKLLWNWLIPAIFGLGKITFFQAFGLKLLSCIVLGTVKFKE